MKQTGRPQITAFLVILKEKKEHEPYILVEFQNGSTYGQFKVAKNK